MPLYFPWRKLWDTNLVYWQPTVFLSINRNQTCWFPCSFMNLIKSFSILMNQGSYSSSLVFSLLCCWREDRWTPGWMDTLSKKADISLWQKVIFVLCYRKTELKSSLIFFHLIKLPIQYQCLLACECVYVYKMKCKPLSQSKRGKACIGRVIAKQCRTWGSQPKCPFRNGSLPSLKAFCEK